MLSEPLEKLIGGNIIEFMGQASTRMYMYRKLFFSELTPLMGLRYK